MREILNNIRQQPEHIKRNILHILTVAFAGVLALLWIYSLGTTLTSSNTQAKVGQDLKPLSALKDNLIGGYNSIIEQPSSSDTGQQTQ